VWVGTREVLGPRNSYKEARFLVSCAENWAQVELRTIGCFVETFDGRSVSWSMKTTRRMTKSPLRLAETALATARQALPPYSSQFSPQGLYPAPTLRSAGAPRIPPARRQPPVPRLRRREGLDTGRAR